MKDIRQIIAENKYNDIRLSWGTLTFTNGSWVFNFNDGSKIVKSEKTSTTKPVERIKKTNIQRGLKLINLDEQYLTKLTKFLQSTKGTRMAQLLNRRPIRALIRDFEAPDAHHRHDDKSKYNLVKSAIKLAKIDLSVPDKHIVDYTHLLYDKQLKGELKLAHSLTHDEMKALNKRDGWKIKRDNSGNPIIKTDSEGRKLYYKESGNPVYKYTPVSHGPGLALRLHLLEEHKISKWDRKNPAPTEDQKKQDLFPDMLVESYKQKRFMKLCAIREFLAKKYGNSQYVAPRFRVLEVVEGIPSAKEHCRLESPVLERKLAVCEENISNTALKDKLEKLIHIEKKPNVIAYEIYDSNGSYRVAVAA